ncbi:MAG TPA: hypothetical protein VFT78_06120 [Hanamia sp.]|nr:hypothetical protein [Hanamia sp.]
MNKYIYILAISTSFIFFSCKKDTTPTTVDYNYGKVKSYTETLTTPTFPERLPAVLLMMRKTGLVQ